MKTQKNKTTTKANNNKKNKTKETHKKQKIKKDPPHFSKCFFTCSLPVSSSKSLEHNPFTLLKLCYLLNAIFF